MKTVLPSIPFFLPSGASGRSFVSCRPARALALLLAWGGLAAAAPISLPAPASLTAIPPAAPVRSAALGHSDRMILAQPRAAQRATIAEDEAREGIRVRRTFPRLGDLRVIEL